MSNRTNFKLIGIDDDSALYLCSYCNNIIPVELDENGDIDVSLIDETCPECGAFIIDIDLD